MASVPLRISDAQTVSVKSARRGPTAGDLDFVFDRSGDSRSSTSVVWLAIRTSRPYLSATNVRLRAHPASGPSVRASSRGPLPSCGSCTLGASSPGVPLPAMSMGDARPGRPVDDLGVTPCHAPQSPSTIGGAPGIQGALRRFDPTIQASGCFHSLLTPRARLPRPFISRPFSSGGRRCQDTFLLDAAVAGWGGCASGIRWCS
jgi:hypothetical protein